MDQSRKEKVNLGLGVYVPFLLTIVFGLLAYFENSIFPVAPERQNWNIPGVVNTLLFWIAAAGCFLVTIVMLALRLPKALRSNKQTPTQTPQP